MRQVQGKMLYVESTASSFLAMLVETEFSLSCEMMFVTVVDVRVIVTFTRKITVKRDACRWLKC